MAISPASATTSVAPSVSSIAALYEYARIALWISPAVPSLSLTAATLGVDEAAVVGTRADEGHVRHHRMRARHGVEIVLLVGPLEAEVACRGVLLDVHVLQITDVPLVGVEGVVQRAGDHDVLAVPGAAERLDAVVLAHVRLHVVDLRARTARVEGDAVELIVLLQLEAGELDAQILERPAARGRIGPAVLIRRIVGVEALGRARPCLEVIGRVAEQHQAAPVTARTAARGQHRGEDDRRLGGALCHQLGAAADDQRAAVAALDGHARVDRQRGAVLDGDDVDERMSAGPAGVGLDRAADLAVALLLAPRGRVGGDSILGGLSTAPIAGEEHREGRTGQKQTGASHGRFLSRQGDASLHGVTGATCWRHQRL